MEEVYQLRLPSFSEIVRPSFGGFDSNPQLDKAYYSDSNLLEILEDGWQTFSGFQWRSWRYFKKSNYIGEIHTDLPDSESDTTLGRTVWGINWIYGGDGFIEYWQWTDTLNIGVMDGPINDRQVHRVPRYRARGPAYKKYELHKDKAYLVNATLPHRAGGTFGRQVFSLRTDDHLVRWSDIVDRFRRYIV